MIGLQAGEKKTVAVSAEDAYGSYDENLFIEIPKKNVPESVTPEVGMRLQLVNQQGQAAHVVVTEILDKTVRLDANHPLAGKTLVFDLEVLEIL